MIYKETKAFFRGQGLKAKPTIGQILGSYEGCFLQKRAFRNFLFIGSGVVEVIHNRGNFSKTRMVVDLKDVVEIYVADYDAGIPKDVVFIKSGDEEIVRFNDADPIQVDEILDSLRSQVGDIGNVKIHRFQVYKKGSNP